MGRMDTSHLRPAPWYRSGGPSAGVRLVVAGFIASALSSPAQSFGIAFYVDPLLGELPVSRTGLGALYGAATLAAAAMLPRIGAFADRMPPRHFIPGVVGLLGLALATLSLVEGPIGLVIVLFAMRLLGQGAIGLGNVTAVSHAYERHRAKALAAVTLGYPIGEMIFPLLIIGTIAWAGWRGSLQLIAAGYVLIAVGALWWIIGPHRPSTPASESVGGHTPTESHDGSLGEVLRHPVFLIAVIASAALPLAITGILFHQVALFERLGWGLASVPPALAFFATGGVAGTVIAGATLDRIHPRWGFVIAGLLAALGTGLAAFGLTHWAPFATLLGLASGIGGGANGIIWSHYFGLPMLGRIKGTVTAVRNGATALGPPIVAIGLQGSDAVRGALVLLTAIFAGMIVLGWRLPALATGFQAHSTPPRYLDPQ